MELKLYQNEIINDLRNYLSCLNEEQELFKAWTAYWTGKNIADPVAYKNKIAGVPNVCLKVPTGGGKTFIACAALKPIFAGLARRFNKFVVWLVPSDAILTQTINALSSKNHPYRERLKNDFDGRVEIFSKDMILNAQNFSPGVVQENLCVVVLSYASLRINSTKKDVRKVYQENGALKIFDAVESNGELLEDTPESAPIQILRKFNPVVIVDESHNADSKLSVEMLAIVNPAFILELTATPRDTSNIVSCADNRKLMAEHMVKLPMLVKNCLSVDEVLLNAIKTQHFLELEAKKGEYVRPIVLFQAQPNTSEDNETFGKLKKKLISCGIPAEQIAIKTSNINELKGVDLLSPACPIRFIITVNALKEGWDCPFAYVLASLANKSSRVDVEQIVGRILRQPNTRHHAAAVLNVSFVYTCSQNFFDTLESIITGLNRSGFSKKDYRVIGEEKNITAVPAVPAVQGTLYTAEDIEAVDGQAVKIASENTSPAKVTEFVDEVSRAIENHEREAESNSGFKNFYRNVKVEERLPMQEQFAASARDLKIPQFLEKISAGLFGEESKLLEREDLSRDFCLRTQDAQINFSFNANDMYKIDLQEQGEAVPRYMRLSQWERNEFNRWIKNSPPDKKIRRCADTIAAEINKNNRYSLNDVRDYVKRIVESMTAAELEEMTLHYEFYAAQIKRKIDELEKNYRRKVFNQQLASGKIFCEDFYSLPQFIAPSKNVASIPKSLYESEGGMNNFERRAISALAELDSVVWWHRNIERQEFCLNGWLNHYPDFILMTTRGNIILLETKGEHLGNEDSKEKISLGREWQSQAGRNYRYFMVFDGAPIENSFALNDFLNVVQEL